MELQEIELPGGLKAKAGVMGECTVFLSEEPGGLHLSISHPKRDPTYYEIKEARYLLCPDDVHMAMIFPPRSEFVNVDKHCFHLFQIAG
jgi:hypothetical protein